VASAPAETSKRTSSSRSSSQAKCLNTRIPHSTNYIRS